MLMSAHPQLSPRSIWLLTAILLAFHTGGAGAQTQTIDEGTFSIMLEGTRVGREDFSIRSTPGTVGRAIVAQGNVLLGENRVSIVLNTDSGGAPLRYRSVVRHDGDVVENIAGDYERGIWLGRTIRRDGESSRELRLPLATLVVEEGVVHPLWLVLSRGPTRSLNLLSPRTLTVTEVTVEDSGPDRVSLGLREFVTRKWVIRRLEGFSILYEVWTDIHGRILRVSIPGQAMEVIRDDPPPETLPSSAP